MLENLNVFSIRKKEGFHTHVPKKKKYTNQPTDDPDFFLRYGKQTFF